MNNRSYTLLIIVGAACLYLTNKKLDEIAQSLKELKLTKGE